MGLTYADLSMSLDGFIAGPNVRVANGMDDDGGPAATATCFSDR
jgi:hypothetical protein